MSVRQYIPTLYDANTTDFTSNGYGFLADGISCEVTETLNESFELEMQYPVAGVYYDNIQIGNIIASRTNTSKTTKEPFRIYRITKPIDGIVTVYAQHISYDLAGYATDRTNEEYDNTEADVSTIISFIEQCAMAYISSVGGINFSFTAIGDFDPAPWSISNFTDVRAIMRKAAQQYNGQWEYTGTNCILHSRRGENRGVSVEYGKNLSDLTEDADISETYTHIMPYYNGTEGEGDDRRDVFVGGLSAAVATGASIGYTRTKPYDLSSVFAHTPSVSELQERTQKYIDTTEIGRIVVSRSIEGVQRGKTIEYPQLEGNEIIEIGDTITVKVPILGVDASMQCTRLTYDAYLDIITSYDIGDLRKSFVSTSEERLDNIDDKIRDIDDWESDIDDKIDELEEKLNERAPTLFIQEEAPESTEDDPLVTGDYWIEIDSEKYANAFYKYSNGWTVQCYYRKFDPLISDIQPEETTSAIKQYDLWFCTSLSDDALETTLNIGQLKITDIQSMSEYSDNWNKCIYGYSTGSPAATIDTNEGDYWFTTDADGNITTLWICTSISKSGQSFTATWGHIYPTDETGRNPTYYIKNRDVVQKGDMWLKVQSGTFIAQGLSKWNGSIGSNAWDKVVDFYEEQQIPSIYIQTAAVDPATQYAVKNGDYWIIINNTTDKYIQAMMQRIGGTWVLQYQVGGGGGGSGITVNISHAILIQKA